MLTLDAYGRPCYANSAKGAPSHPQRVIKEKSSSHLNIASGGNNSNGGNLGSNSGTSSAAGSQNLSPRGGPGSFLPSAPKTVTSSINSSSSSSSSSSSATSATGSSNQTSLNIPPIRPLSKADGMTSSSASDLYANNNQNNGVTIDKLKSRVRELEAEVEKQRRHAQQAEECIKNYRGLGNPNMGGLGAGRGSRTSDSSCQTDGEGLDSSSLISARNNAFNSGGSGEMESKMNRLQAENNRFQSIIEEFRVNVRSLTASGQAKDAEIASLKTEIGTLREQAGGKDRLSSPRPPLATEVATVVTVKDSTNSKSSVDMRGLSTALADLRRQKHDLNTLRTSVSLAINSENQFMEAQFKNLISILSQSTKKVEPKQQLEVKVVELEMELRSRADEKNIHERTLQLLTQENNELRRQEEKLTDEVQALTSALALKEAEIAAVRSETRAKIEVELAGWKAAQRTSNRNDTACDPMTPLKTNPVSAPPSASKEKEQEKSLLEQLKEEINKTLALKTENADLRSKCVQGLKSLAALQESYRKEKEALKHCSHVKDLGRIAQHRELSLERDKLGNELRHSKEILSIVTCSLSTAEQSLAESQPAAVAKLSEGRSKRIKLVEKASQERGKDIEQRSMETCAVSSQHLEAFQKKASDKLKLAADESIAALEALKKVLSLDADVPVVDASTSIVEAK